MQPVAGSVASTYTPSSASARTAAEAFVSRFREWEHMRADALSKLGAYVRESLGMSASGFLSRDPLEMTAYGLVFQNNPGPGFIPVPSAIAASLQEQGLRGGGYIPDTRTEVGATTLRHLHNISRIGAQRPVLSGVPGLAPLALEGDRLVLSHAAIDGGAVTIKAASGAVAPGADLKQSQAPAQPMAKSNPDALTVRSQSAMRH